MKPVVATFSKELLLQHVASKRVMASQCTDEVGNPCLKLRFHDNTEKKCGSSNIDLHNGSIKEKNVKEKMHSNIDYITTIKNL